MMIKPPLLLASSSQYRQSLLLRLGLDFQCASPNIDESPIPEEAATELVQRLATEKALALRQQYPKHLIIGSDQVASIDGAILGKPGNFDNAMEQLSRCSGRRITFSTGLCLLNAQSGRQQVSCVDFHVQFRHLSQNQISNYLKLEQPYDCAGSFKYEGLGICLFQQLEGDDPNSLIGLPLIKLCDMLIEEGVNPLEP